MKYLINEVNKVNKVSKFSKIFYNFSEIFGKWFNLSENSNNYNYLNKNKIFNYNN
jgi:hypothetical protein